MYLFLQFDGPINCAKETMSSAVAHPPWRGGGWGWGGARARERRLAMKRPREAMKDSRGGKGQKEEKKARLLFIKVNCQQKAQDPPPPPVIGGAETLVVFLSSKGILL